MTFHIAFFVLAKQIATATLLFTVGRYELEKSCIPKFIRDEASKVGCGDKTNLTNLAKLANQKFPLIKPAKFYLCEGNFKGFIFPHVYEETCKTIKEGRHEYGGEVRVDGEKQCLKSYPKSIWELFDCPDKIFDNCVNEQHMIWFHGYKSYAIWPTPIDVKVAAKQFLTRKDDKNSGCIDPTQVCFPCTWSHTSHKECKKVGKWREHYGNNCYGWDCWDNVEDCHYKKKFTCTPRQSG